MTYQEFQKRFPIKLNSQQQEAVLSVDGPTLLLAVPGSGKTTVLIMRLGYMIFCQGIAPESILTLTYTIAATKDMSERFCSFFGKELGSRLEFRTINGICAKIIAYYGRKIGKNAFELVTEDKDTTSMLSAIYQKVEGGFATESDLKDIRTLITYIKNMMLGEKEIQKLDEEAGFKISQIYQRYRLKMREAGLMDYDDQMVYALNILKSDLQTLQYFQQKYAYICVDEAQDTSKIQHEIIALLAKKNENLFMVGDEDQSIYGFRAAYPEALLSFEQNHPKAKVLLMEENFRSNAKIVEAADSFIQKNSFRHEKHMQAHRKEGADIREICLKSRSAQYTYLLKVASECEKQTAILYRDNESVLPLVDLLERGEIPYKMRNADLSFFTNRVVLDIQNIMKFALNPYDTELFMQIYYKMSTYINKKTAIMMCEISETRKLPVLEAVISYGRLASYTEKHIRSLQRHLENLLEEPTDKAIYRIVKCMGYEEYLERMNLSDSKLFILKELGSKCGTPEIFLKRMEELQTLIREKKNDANSPFILSTIHASKGLEYDRVFLLDIADGIFPETVVTNPKKAEAGELKQYEEERRLFYVGVTRAKNDLHLFTINRNSIFIQQLLKKQNIVTEPDLRMTSDKLSKQGQQYRNFQPANPYLATTLAKQRNRERECENAYQQFEDSIGEGVLVTHKIFGDGVVVQIDGEVVTIRFAEGMKRLGLRLLFEKKLLTVPSLPQ